MKKQQIKNLTLLCISILLLLFVVGGIFWCGGLGPFMAYARGEAIYLSPNTLDLGPCEAGAETVAVFNLSNLTSQKIRVVGERSSCNCAFSEQIPILVPPKKSVDIKVNISLPQYDDSYDQTITFMIAEPNRLAMHPVRVTASIPNPLSRPIETDENE